MSNLQTVVAGIYEIDSLDDMERVWDAAKARQKELRDRASRINAASIKVGDKVRLRDISPKYLNGAIVEVTKIEGKKVGVKPIEETNFQARNRLGMGGRVPAACVEPA